MALRHLESHAFGPHLPATQASLWLAPGTLSPRRHRGLQVCLCGGACVALQLSFPFLSTFLPRRSCPSCLAVFVVTAMSPLLPRALCSVPGTPGVPSSGQQIRTLATPHEKQNKNNQTIPF